MKTLEKKNLFLEKNKRALLRMLILSILLGFLSLYFSTGRYGAELFLFYFKQPQVIVLNILPFILLGYICLAVFNRIWVGFLFNGLFCFVFTGINYWKLLARDAPLYASDLGFVVEAIKMSKAYIGYGFSAIIIIACIFFAALVLAFRFGEKVFEQKTRIILFFVSIVLGIALYLSAYNSFEIYKGCMHWPKVNAWSTANAQISRGGIYPFIYSFNSANIEKPFGYDQDEIEQVLASYENNDIAEEKKVSVIMVMLEAFTDLSSVTDSITASDPYRVYHELQKESYVGNLVPNAFAGGTYDTEQCVMTGFSKLSDFKKPSWSYARYFLEQGYKVNGAHAGYSEFYNRIEKNANLGFPEYRFIDNYYRNLLNDKEILRNEMDPEMLNYLETSYSADSPMDYMFLTDIVDYCKDQIDEGTPVYSFNVTYQNHGPYWSDVGYFSEEYIPRQGLSEADYNIVNNYLYGIEDTAQQVMNMVDSFREYEEPVVLVFFGDHKPWLGDQNATYHALNIDIDGGSEESFFNYYSTDYIIWANDVAKDALGNDFIGVGPTISPCYLMNVLFEQCGWEGPAYQKMTDEVLNELPVVHQTGIYYMKNGLRQKTELTDIQLELLERMEKGGYYLMYDADTKMPN